MSTGLALLNNNEQSSQTSTRNGSIDFPQLLVVVSLVYTFRDLSGCDTPMVAANNTLTETPQNGNTVLVSCNFITLY